MKRTLSIFITILYLVLGASSFGSGSKIQEESTKVTLHFAKNKQFVLSSKL